MSRTAADYLAETLAAAGVARIYGAADETLRGLIESVRRIETVDWIHVRHEEGVAFAAGAEAQLTGRLAVCAGSCGPGNLRLVDGLMDCHRSGVPVLAIAAQVPSTEIGIDYFQATHPDIVFKDCSHYVEHVSSPELLPQILARAMRVAVARRGVAVVIISGDTALRPLATAIPGWWSPNPPQVRPCDNDLLELANLLNDSSRITLLCGAGCAGAHDEIIAVATRLKAPIVHTLRAKEFLDYDNPCSVGMTGLAGLSSGYAAMKDCDALLLLGTDFPYRQFYPDGARIAQGDLRAEALGNRCGLHIGMLGDVTATLAALLPRLVEKSDTDHLNAALDHYDSVRRDADALAQDERDADVIQAHQLIQLVSEVAAEDAIFTCDVGSTVVWMARHLQVNGRRRIVGSFNQGSTASSLFQAIGAQSAFPGRQVISISSDADFTQSMGHFMTLQGLGLPVKVVLLNNGVREFLEMEIVARGSPDSGGVPKTQNFAEIATAMGIKGIRIETPIGLKAALREALAHDCTVLVDVVAARQELRMPGETSTDPGSSPVSFMTKAVLDGRANALIDLAGAGLAR